MKRRFEFRLERVRHVRDLEERVARAERTRAEGAARAAEQRRDTARLDLERSRAVLRALLTGAPDPRTILRAQELLDGELNALRSRIEMARTLRMQAERLATHHGERRSAARALEELRARSRQRHLTAVERLDNVELDEIAQRRARRRASPEPSGNPEGASRSAPSGTDQQDPPGRAP